MLYLQVQVATGLNRHPARYRSCRPCPHDLLDPVLLMKIPTVWPVVVLLGHPVTTIAKDRKARPPAWLTGRPNCRHAIRQFMGLPFGHAPWKANSDTHRKKEATCRGKMETIIKNHPNVLLVVREIFSCFEPVFSQLF